MPLGICHLLNIFVNILIQEESDCPDLEYNYGDTDTHLCEMAELYSYSELEDYQTNIQVIRKLNNMYIKAL